MPVSKFELNRPPPSQQLMDHIESQATALLSSMSTEAMAPMAPTEPAE